VADLYPDVRIGLVYTVHTFGRDQGFKPHVHLVMTKGGLKDDAWVEIDRLSPARLSAKWRYGGAATLQAPPTGSPPRPPVAVGHCPGLS
jgi:hypothetical protein